MSTTTLSTEAVNWLAHGERGLSSNAIFTRLTGVDACGERGFPFHYPHDPSDLCRCLRLLESVPEFAPRIGEMAGVSSVWTALVAHWVEIVALLENEAPKWREREGTAPKTYARMREIIEGARA